MATFDGAGFSEKGAGGGTFFSIHGARVNYTIHKIPGGSKSFLQLGATPPVDFDMPAQCTASQLSALRGKINVSGTLAYSWGSFTAVLAEVADVKEVKSGQDYFQMTLRFQVYP